MATESEVKVAEVGGASAESPSADQHLKGTANSALPSDFGVEMPKRRQKKPFIARLGKAILRIVRKLWNRCDTRLMRIASKSPLLSSWYYALFNRSFDREHRAVLCGRLKYEKSRSGPNSTSSLLRRNIHRLEKGLLSRPRRSVFARDYIGETVKFFDAAVRAHGYSKIVSEDELNWARDVLVEFFAVTGPSPCLDAARRLFESIPNPVVERRGSRPRTPYRRDLTVEPPVAYDDLLALAWRRRSVRWFAPTPVPRDLIEKAASVAALSPSACNRQPFLFRVYDDLELIRDVAALPGGTKGFQHNFPAIVVVVGELRNYYGERDRHVVYIDASLAAMSFVYAAETLGLGTCCINWPDIEVDEQRAADLLQLEPDQRPVMFIAVGYPDPEGLVAHSQKKPIDQICQYNVR